MNIVCVKPNREGHKWLLDHVDAVVLLQDSTVEDDTRGQIPPQIRRFLFVRSLHKLRIVIIEPSYILESRRCPHKVFVVLLSSCYSSAHESALMMVEDI